MCVQLCLNVVLFYNNKRNICTPSSFIYYFTASQICFQDISLQEFVRECYINMSLYFSVPVTNSSSHSEENLKIKISVGKHRNLMGDL